MSSSAFSLTALHNADDLAITHGDVVVGGIHGEDIAHYFCAHCMTWMFTRPKPLPDIVNVRPTMFDAYAGFVPFIETFTRTKLPWATTSATHSFEEFPPMETFGALLQEFANRP